MNPATDLRSGHDRRHKDSPSLWLTVLAGSLIVHLLLLLSGRLFLFRVSSQKPAGVAAPIELVDLSSKSSSTTRSTRSSAPNVITNPAASQSAVSSEAASQRAAPIQPAIVPRITPRTVRFPPRVPKVPLKTEIVEQPKPIREQKPRPQSASPVSSPPAQPLAPSSPAPTQPLPSQIADPNASEPGQDFTPSGTPLTKPLIPGEGVTNLGSPTDPNAQAPAPALPSVPVDEQRGEGNGVEVALSNPQLGNDGRTIPDQPARPIELSKPIPDANYPPVIGLNLGQSVRLRLLVKSTGKLDPVAITVLEGSRSTEYDKQAIELVKQWMFKPALQAGQPVDSLLDISVRLDAL